jgi:thiamine monophosphate kinase
VTAGEDFELCVCVAPEQRERVQAAVADVSWIGRVVEGRGARFFDTAGERALAGHEHRLE